MWTRQDLWAAIRATGKEWQIVSGSIFVAIAAYFLSGIAMLKPYALYISGGAIIVGVLLAQLFAYIRLHKRHNKVKYEMPIKDVIERLRPNDNSSGQLLQVLSSFIVDFRQHAISGDLSIWARLNCRPGNEKAHPLVPVDAAIWKDAQLSLVEILDGCRGRTENTNPIAKDVPDYYDFHLNKAQVDEKWPPRRRKIKIQSPIKFVEE